MRSWPATATSGAHGLAAMAVTGCALAGSSRVKGGSDCGMAGGPSGLLRAVGLKSRLGATGPFGWLAAFLRSPPAIQSRIVAMAASGILGLPSGICGAPSSRATALYRRLEAARPAITASPDPPPFSTPAYASRLRPDRISLALWQAKQ